LAHRAKNPAIAMRDGVSASCLAMPRLRSSPWETVLDHLVHRLPSVSRDQWLRRMQAGTVLDEAGRPLPTQAPYAPGTRIYYWRELPDEAPVPFREEIVFEDEWLVVADKPHYLPVTPGGRYVRETLLVRLKRRLNCPDLSPLHRIDRETAGLVVLCKRPQDRDTYQRLFREKRVSKTYEAIASSRASMTFPLTRHSHIREDEQAFYRMREARPEEGLAPNSQTHIAISEIRGDWARYALQPVTGKRHQLRVHMNGLGLPLLGDQFYPTVRRQPDEAEDFAEPLRLLAKAIAFTDPVNGAERLFHSRQALVWP